MGLPGISCEALTNVVRARTLAGRIGNRGPLPRLVSKRDPRFRHCPRLSPFCFSFLVPPSCWATSAPALGPPRPLVDSPFRPAFFLYLDFCRVLFGIKCITRSVCHCAVCTVVLPPLVRQGWLGGFPAVSRGFPGRFPGRIQLARQCRDCANGEFTSGVFLGIYINSKDTVAGQPRAHRKFALGLWSVPRIFALS